jgi:hypothetical protein
MARIVGRWRSSCKQKQIGYCRRTAPTSSSGCYFDRKMPGVIDRSQVDLAILSEAKGRDRAVKCTDSPPSRQRRFENSAENGANQVAVTHQDSVTGSGRPRKKSGDNFLNSSFCRPTTFQRNSMAWNCGGDEFSQHRKRSPGNTWQLARDNLRCLLRSLDVTGVDLSDGQFTQASCGKTGLPPPTRCQRSVITAFASYELTVSQ